MAGVHNAPGRCRKCGQQAGMRVRAHLRVLSTTTFTVQLTGRIFTLHPHDWACSAGVAAAARKCLLTPAPGRSYKGGAPSASRPHNLGTLRTLTCPARPAEATDRWMRAVTAKGPEVFTAPTSWWALTAAPHVGDGNTASERPHSTRNYRPQTHSARHRSPRCPWHHTTRRKPGGTEQPLKGPG